MRTIFNDHERTALLRRINALTPDTPARWGRMDAHRMVCHLHDVIESGFADFQPAHASGGLLSWFPLNWLVINVLPWPKGKLESPPDPLATVSGTWAEDVAALRAALEKAAAKGPDAEWPASDVFGPLSGRSWGALLRTHINYHLRQFGV
jgi:hypothetical protein